MLLGPCSLLATNMECSNKGSNNHAKFSCKEPLLVVDMQNAW